MATLQEHMEAIDDALDGFACDSSVSLLDYATAMEDIAYRVKLSAQAAQDDLVRA